MSNKAKLALLVLAILTALTGLLATPNALSVAGAQVASSH